MGLLDRMAVKATFKRLVDAKIATKSETPLAADTSARPGQTHGASAVLITDLAIYLGKIGAIGAIRILITDLSDIEITQNSTGIGYRFTYGSDKASASFETYGRSNKTLYEGNEDFFKRITALANEVNIN